jgi:hypothetical protein
MSRVLHPSGIVGTIGPPIVAFFLVWFLSKLPREVIDLAMLWVLVSVLPAIMFGHCALTQER